MTLAQSADFLVSTDLDGTLLDHYSYSWAAALPSIQRLKSLHVPIIINTSKTFAEVEDLQASIGLNAPFIVENGSAIYLPNGKGEFKRVVCGCERDDIVTFLHALRNKNKWDFAGYSDWKTEDIIQHTGLNEEGAKQSQAREFSEPLLWNDSEEHFSLFQDAIAASPFRLIKGGRFIHILGKSDKGAALQHLQQLIDANDAQLICLGDSHNDCDMLNIADIPVFVRSPVHDFPAYNPVTNSVNALANTTINTKNSKTHTPIYTKLCGPEGWHEAFTQILDN